MFICNHNSNKHHALLAAKDFVYSQPTWSPTRLVENQ
jgi:hypothetical protein